MTLTAPCTHARRIILTTIGLTGILWAHSCSYEPPPATAVRAVKTSRLEERAAKLVDSHTAHVICTRSKRPRTMLAIAAVESGKNGPQITGDHGRSRGIFQVQSRHWSDVIGGEVADDLETQVAQADAVFDVLVETYGYKEAVRRWNGDGEKSRLYRQKVNRILAKL